MGVTCALYTTVQYTLYSTHLAVVGVVSGAAVVSAQWLYLANNWVEVAFHLYRSGLFTLKHNIVFKCKSAYHFSSNSSLVKNV